MPRTDSPRCAPWKEGRTVWLEDKVYHTAGGQRYRVALNAANDPVALILDDEDDDECACNVALIVAAPSTLDALERLLAAVESRVGDALAYGCEITDPDHPWHEDVMKAREAVRAAGRVENKEESHG